MNWGGVQPPTPDNSNPGPGVHLLPHFGEGEVVRGQRWWFRLFIVTIVLSLTIRPQFSIPARTYHVHVPALYSAPV